MKVVSTHVLELQFIHSVSSLPSTIVNTSSIENVIHQILNQSLIISSLISFSVVLHAFHFGNNSINLCKNILIRIMYSHLKLFQLNLEICSYLMNLEIVFFIFLLKLGSLIELNFSTKYTKKFLKAMSFSSFLSLSPATESIRSYSLTKLKKYSLLSFFNNSMNQSLCISFINHLRTSNVISSLVVSSVKYGSKCHFISSVVFLKSYIKELSFHLQVLFTLCRV